MFQYCEPPTNKIAEYGKTLFSKVSEAYIVRPASVSIGEWEPQPKRCHENVDTWVLNSSKARAIRGWFYIPLDGLCFARFVAHSVIEDEFGEKFDITPVDSSQQYAFIDAGVSENEFADVIQRLEAARDFAFLDVLK
ncbi:hypothetical protein ACO0LO_19520 [Undibacterium sp. TJN25]|uniref:hypothetical protein n=1 Tax=Undibacterium sp. TJN25 TaxID=3413056 RepID=UPI003BEFEAAE